MGCPLIDLFLLLLSGVLSGGIDLMVQQEPPAQELAPGDKVNMTCNVTWTEGMLFRVEWRKDNETLHKGPLPRWNSSNVTWGYKDQFVRIWKNIIILSLDDVKAKDSGCYVCHVTMEIPGFKTAKGNGTYLTVSDSFKGISKNKGFPDYVLWLLVASAMAGSGAVLGRIIWRFHSRNRDSGNHVYGNVLYYHQKVGAMPGKDKILACALERKRGESIYSTSFPKPPPQRAPEALPNIPQPVAC